MKEEKVPTAEEFLAKHEGRPVSLIRDRRLNIEAPYAVDAMKEFAKLHVTAALKVASEKAQCRGAYKSDEGHLTGGGINKESILNAYPQENIT
jgi:hypothetical protein